MSRIPIRWRLTILSAFVMTVVLTAAGVVLYARLSSDVLAAVDSGLRSRADTLGAGIDEAGANFGDEGGLVEPDEAFAQILGPDGAALDSSAALGDRLLLTPQEVADVREPSFSDVTLVLGDEQSSVRLLAMPAASGTVVVVGASLKDQRNALARLGSLLFWGIPIAILVTTGLAWLLAGAALRPIDRMTEEVENLAERSLDARLSVPPSGDEVAHLGTTFNALLDRLQETVERERRLVDDASHELRTPLGILRTELEVALRGPQSQGALRAAIESGIEESDRLSELAEELLVLARFERGALPMNPESTDLTALVAETAASFQNRAAASRIDLRCLAETPVRAVFDPARLRQVAMNLLDNALDHTPDGGEVSVGVDRDGNEIVLSVADSGQGFEDSLVPRVFEPFSRADASRSRRSGGAGLGLAIVRAIVEAHGGSVEASNREGGGALVTCRLPGEAAP